MKEMKWNEVQFCISLQYSFNNRNQLLEGQAPAFQNFSNKDHLIIHLLCLVILKIYQQENAKVSPWRVLLQGVCKDRQSTVTKRMQREAGYCYKAYAKRGRVLADIWWNAATWIKCSTSSCNTEYLYSCDHLQHLEWQRYRSLKMNRTKVIEKDK